MLLPFMEAKQQVEGENVVKCSCICPVVVGVMKALEQLKTSNLSYHKNLVKTLQDPASKKLLPFLNSINYRLASPFDPKFKDKRFEDDAQKKVAMRLLQMHVTTRLGQCKKIIAAQVQMMKTKFLPKSQDYLGLLQLVQKRENLVIQ